jgi:RHS repeat-associated protein
VYESNSNRLVSVGLDGLGSATVTHDDFGQMTALPNIHALQWDAAGRLRSTRRASGSTADRVWYVYDGGGQRVRKVSETWDAGASAWRPLASTTYVGGLDVVRAYVGGTLDDEVQTLHCSDGSAGSGGGGRMLLVETRTVEDGAAVATPTPLQRFQFDNHLGSAALETTEDGSVLSYEEFHPYGSTAWFSGTAALDANPKRYRYSGKERDTESGLTYYGARYLAPWLGRWVSPDPSGFVDGVNVYAFVRGRPSTGWDAEGRESIYSIAMRFGANAGLLESNAEAPRSTVLHDSGAEVGSSYHDNFSMTIVANARFTPDSMRTIGDANASASDQVDSLVGPALSTAASTFDDAVRTVAPHVLPLPFAAGVISGLDTVALEVGDFVQSQFNPLGAFLTAVSGLSGMMGGPTVNLSLRQSPLVPDEGGALVRPLLNQISPGLTESSAFQNGERTGVAVGAALITKGVLGLGAIGASTVSAPPNWTMAAKALRYF